MASTNVIKGDAESFSTYNWNAPIPEALKRIAPASFGPPPPSQNEIEEAFQRGFREGEKQGRASQEQRVAAAVEELTAVTASVAAARSAILQSAQSDLVRLSVAIARRILHREVLMAPDVLEGIVTVVLDRLESCDILQLRAHPSMVERLERSLRQKSPDQAIAVIGDAGLRPGGCIFETKRGQVDAGIESQLAEIERGLADRLETRR